MVSVKFDGRLLLKAKTGRGLAYLWETDNEQYLALVDGEFAVCCTYDFDYRPLAETLDELIQEIVWADFSMMEIVQDWIEVDCGCVDLALKIEAYIEALGEDL